MLDLFALSIHIWDFLLSLRLFFEGSAFDESGWALAVVVGKNQILELFDWTLTNKLIFLVKLGLNFLQFLDLRLQGLISPFLSDQ